MVPAKIVETPAPPDQTVTRPREPPPSVVESAAVKPKRVVKRISKLHEKKRETEGREQDREGLLAKAAALSPATVMIERRAEPSAGPERRSRVTATITFGRQTITTTRETVIIPLQPDENAASIDRPPLKVVSIPPLAARPGS